MTMNDQDKDALDRAWTAYNKSWDNYLKVEAAYFQTRGNPGQTLEDAMKEAGNALDKDLDTLEQARAAMWKARNHVN